MISLPHFWYVSLLNNYKSWKIVRIVGDLLVNTGEIESGLLLQASELAVPVSNPGILDRNIMERCMDSLYSICRVLKVLR